MNRSPSPGVSSQAHSPPKPAWQALVRIAAAGLCLLCLTAADSTSVTSAPATPGTTATTSTAFLASLSEEERAWLHAHPVIRVVQDPYWPPIEFEDERGNPSGMTKDYLTLIEQRLGRKFEPVLHLSWQEALARMRRGEIDMTTTVAETPERLKFLAFTQPYMTIPIVIATQQDVTYIGNLHELKGKKVAAVDGFAVHEWLQKDFPEVRLLTVKTSLEGLQRLQSGEVDAFIDSLATIGHHQARRDVLNLKIAGATPYVNAQRMAVRKDWAPLAGILQKALDSISVAERDEIFRRWLPIRYEYGVDYTPLWPVAAFLAIVLMGLGLWNWKLAAEIRLRKQTAEALRHTQALLTNAEKIGGVGGWEIDVQTLQTTWTEGVYDIYELDGIDRLTLDEVINYYAPASRPIIEQAVQRAIEQGEPFDLDLEIITAKGNRRSVHAVGEPDLVHGKVTGFFQDITERKRAELALHHSEDRWMFAIEGSGDGLWDWNIQTGVAFYSLRYKEMFGYVEADFGTTSDEWSKRIHPDDAPGVFAALRPYMDGKPGAAAVEFRMLCKDGGWKWTLGRGTVVSRDADGKPLRMIGTNADITERKQAEAHRLESEQLRKREQAATLEVQRQAGQTALSLMEDAVAARRQAESMTETLTEQLDELRRWQQVTLGREGRVLTMKKEVNSLLAELGQPPRYPSAVDAEAN